ncbi:hypothetical protein Xmau_00751 [Xenorhabdus mauleonii]|uniref:Uncharacterized protein n=1 Tax=Xenorhabdus mauleonii TaxID=351675 RepID=A0A1I3S3U2_9GAMM|nr:hypothetical protein Xmau_00751 [Xenorhabdus mauleonii]SFJ52257.1 hypothetical protein SAMN05421680_110141 [Xenorhabdus mauleonii]
MALNNLKQNAIIYVPVVFQVALCWLRSFTLVTVSINIRLPMLPEVNSLATSTHLEIHKV